MSARTGRGPAASSILAVLVVLLMPAVAASRVAHERAPDETGSSQPVAAEAEVHVAQGPETSSRPTRFRGSQFNRRWFHYVESSQRAPAGRFETPLEVMNETLHTDGYKCIGYKELDLSPGYRVDTGFRQFGDKTYVLQCKGACDDVFYTVGVRAYNDVTHFGARFYFPVVEASTGLGYITAAWSIENRSASPGHEVKLRVYQWTNDTGDYGGGCKLYE